MEKTELRAQLAALGLTCDEFAALLGVSLATVYDWGGRYPVPYGPRLVLHLLQERGGTHGLLGRPERNGNRIAPANMMSKKAL